VWLVRQKPGESGTDKESALKSKTVAPVVVTAWCCLLLSAGCGGDPPGGGGGHKVGTSTADAAGAQKTVEPEEPVSGSSTKWDPSKGTATIRGVVKFDGKPPRRRAIDMRAKAQCREAHTEKVLDESVIVNANGTLKNSFVWVKKGLSRRLRFPLPEKPVELSQKGCIFLPRVVGVQVRQALTVRNDDAFLHNVHGFCSRNGVFNFSQNEQGKTDTVTFTREEVMVPVKCDVHPWMASFVGVVKHPFFAVTGDDGSFEISKLPPGSYTLEAWHERFGTQTVKVTVGDAETKETEFTFKGK